MMREKKSKKAVRGMGGEVTLEEGEREIVRTRTGSGAVRSRSKKDWDPKRVRK
jgi:hypothetical protein